MTGDERPGCEDTGGRDTIGEAKHESAVETADETEAADREVGDATAPDAVGAESARIPLPRYRPPAPYPPPRAAVSGYTPPAGGVWAPPAEPAAPRSWPPPTPPPLHTLTVTQGQGPRWGWKQTMWGLLLGMGPFLALYATTYSMAEDTDYSADDITVATGIIVLVSSAIGYGWQYFAAWLFSVRGSAGKWRAWGFRKPTAAIFWVIPVTLVGAYVVSYVNDILFSPPEQDIVDAFPPTAGGVILFALVAVVMAPLAEELYFRGFVFKGFANSWGWVWAAVISGAVFSLAHLQLSIFLPLFALGFGLAWVYHYTRSLWTSIALHAIFNGISVLAWALTN